MRMRLSCGSLFVSCLGLCNVAASPSLSHTGIGNGGDVVEAYLDETRTRFIDTLMRFQNSEPSVQDTICQNQGLGRVLEDDCASYLKVISSSMMNLHLGSKRLVLELTQDTLSVPGPDGEPFQVAAKTMLGPEGPILFNYARTSQLRPKLLMALMVHETGHKVKIAGDSEKAYVEDSRPIMGFPSGRALLDAAGLAIANFAESNGIIGQNFSIRDTFYCEVRSSEKTTGFYQSGDDQREFSEQQSYDAYRVGIGPDRDVEIGALEGDSTLSLSLLIHEQSGCREDSQGRYVDLKVYRRYRFFPGETPREADLLEQKRIDNWNPICESDPRQHPMLIEAAGIKFTCMYLGMSGATKDRK